MGFYSAVERCGISNHLVVQSAQPGRIEPPERDVILVPMSRFTLVICLMVLGTVGPACGDMGYQTQHMDAPAEQTVPAESPDQEKTRMARSEAAAILPEDDSASDEPSFPEENHSTEENAVVSCAQTVCGAGFHCELKLTESCPASPCLPAPTCIADETLSPTCTDNMCGAGAICELMESDCGLAACPLETVCTPKSCSESPPTQERCDISCSTGFVVIDDAVTCSCCAPAEEDDFITCLDDTVCPASEACDHQFCETPPACQEPGVICPAVCYGRCVAEGLILQPGD